MPQGVEALEQRGIERVIGKLDGFGLAP